MEAFWRKFSYLFAAYSVCVIGMTLYNAYGLLIRDENDNKFIAAAGALAVVAALQYFIWLGLNRYGKAFLVRD
jgi:hypothetical protein